LFIVALGTNRSWAPYEAPVEAPYEALYEAPQGAPYEAPHRRSAEGLGQGV
jgi:hypothetical protein